MEPHVAELVVRAQRPSTRTEGDPFVDRLEAGEVSREELADLAGELYRLVGSDRRSFALLAARFPEPLFLSMACGEDEAQRLLLDFAAAIGVGTADLSAHEPRPLAQAYPAFLAQTAAFGPRSAVPLALLAHAGASGATYTRVADALQRSYHLDDTAVGHFRFLAETPDELLAQAAEVVATGIAHGDDPAESVRIARMVAEYEAVFWSAMDSSCG